MRRLSAAVVVLLPCAVFWLVGLPMIGRGLLALGYPGAAAALFDDPDQKGAAFYLARRWSEAAAAFGTNAANAYNRGNALARAERFAEAVAAYDQALAADPDDEDAAFNKALVASLIAEKPAPADANVISTNSVASRARDTHDESHVDGETGGSGDGFAGSQEGGSKPGSQGSSKAGKSGRAEQASFESGQGQAKGSADDSDGAGRTGGPQVGRPDDPRPGSARSAPNGGALGSADGRMAVDSARRSRTISEAAHPRRKSATKDAIRRGRGGRSMTPSRVLMLVATAGVALCFGAIARAETPSLDAPLGRIEIRADLPNEPPFVGEPIILHVRSSLRANTTRDKILQPVLTDFDWQQFGIDASSEEMLDGFWTPVVERVLMVTPLKAGSLTIPPFTRRVEFFAANEERVEANLVSNSLVIDVRSHEGVGLAEDWWLPAKSVKISDKWEPAPDKIPFGETAHRVLTIEAKGLTADRLPPPPVLRAPGVIFFLGPIDRQTIVTDDGPIARVAYSWNVRPVSATPATAPTIHIPWFDIAARKMRDAVAPERQVAFVHASRKTPGAPAAPQSFSMFSVWPLAAFIMSFVWTSAVVHLIAASKSRGRGWRRLLAAKPPAIAELRRAARANHLRAFRRAVEKLSRADRGA